MKILHPSQEEVQSLPPDKENWITKNPFEEFKTFTCLKTDLPLDQIVQSTEAIMDRDPSGV